MMRSRRTGAFSPILSHRVALWVALGREPDQFVLHSCDNPSCCNPAHLREGSAKDNSQDALSRGRLKPLPAWVGEANRGAKLNRAQVEEIRARSSESAAVLAAEYSVTPRSVRNIITMRTWR
jgi:hypothetical protein